MPAHTHTVTADVTPNDGGWTLGNDGDGTPDTTQATGSTGGGTAHNNLQPYVVLNFIIKT
jgi:microcystin-dependent protein